MSGDFQLFAVVEPSVKNGLPRHEEHVPSLRAVSLSAHRAGRREPLTLQHAQQTVLCSFAARCRSSPDCGGALRSVLRPANSRCRPAGARTETSSNTYNVSYRKNSVEYGRVISSGEFDVNRVTSALKHPVYRH